MGGMSKGKTEKNLSLVANEVISTVNPKDNNGNRGEVFLPAC